MPEKSSSRIRFDDFVNAVHADPAQVEPTVLLAGYLGKSPEEGNVRVYLDPSLCNWLEVPEAEVIHSRPIADSPLGGSQLWVRASAQIKPGAAGAPAPAAGEEGGADKAAADTGVFNPMATIHPTIWTQFCPTGVGCIATIPCLPPSIGCPPGAAGQAGLVGPTGTQGCTQPGHCVGQTGWHTCACPIGPTGYQGCGGGGTAATVCTQFGCPTHMLGCPSTSTCPPAALGAVGPTGTQGCTQPGHCVGQTGWHTCACPIGPTGYQGCGYAGGTAATVCTQLGCPTHMLGCPSTSTCPPAALGAVGPTGTQGCTQPGHCVGQTGWHTCACPIGPTGTQGCFGAEAAGYANNPTAATRCFICPPLDLTAACGPFPQTRPPQCIEQQLPPTRQLSCSTLPPHCIQQDLPPTRQLSCLQTEFVVCPATFQGPPCAAPTGGLGCPSTSTCPPEGLQAAAMVGPTGTQGCTQPGHCVGQTGWHTCACPPGYTGLQGCVGAEEAREARTNWPACQTRTFDCAGQPIDVWNTGHFCALPRFAGPAQGAVITLVTVSGCPHPSWVDACPTRLCMTYANVCLPYTMGGCYPGRQF